MTSAGPSKIVVPPSALVVLIGAAASGKSTFARLQFSSDAIVSSDQLRLALASTNPGRRRNDVFEQLLPIVDQRLEAGMLTVVDATNTDWMRRSELIRLARRHGRPAVAIVFEVPTDVCLSRNASRSAAVPASVARRQVAQIHRDIDRLDLEGFAAVFAVSADADVRARKPARSGS